MKAVRLESRACVAVNPQPVSVQSGRPLLECLAPATRAGQHVIELDLYSHRLTGCIFEDAIIMLEFYIQEAPCALQVSFRVVRVRGVAWCGVAWRGVA